MTRGNDEDSPGLSALDPSAIEDVTEDELADGEVAALGHEPRSSSEVHSGDLVESPAASVLHRLYVEAASGALLLTRPGVKKIVYLRAGYPVAVKSNVVGECLGKILVWEGIISKDQHRGSLIAMRESGIRQGSALIRMGALSHHELSRGLELQLRFKICETFGWTEGDYRFWPTVDPPFESVPLSISPAELVHEGVRTFMPIATVLSALRPLADVFLRPTDDPLLRFQSFGLPVGLEPVLAALDGTARTSELMRVSTRPVRETAGLVYSLLAAGIVEPADEPAPEPDPLHDPELEPEPPTDRDDELDSGRRVDLARLVTRLRRAEPLEVLGLGTGASPVELRRAYHERALERHPDRMGGSAGEGIRELAETALALTAAAFRRVTGRGSARDGPRADDGLMDERVRRIVEAEGYHQAGLELLEKGRAEEAKGLLTRAVEACEQEGDFRASLAWASFQAGLDSDAAHRALVLLDEAIVRSPGLVRAHVYRGHVLRFLERPEDAARAFEEALRRAPDNDEALSELARIRESVLLSGNGE